MAIDPRIVRVGITINDELRMYEGLAITATGSKFGSMTQNDTTIKIANIQKKERDFLATEGTPFNRLRSRNRQTVFVEAGRVSTGTAVVFNGDITLIQITQPPEITVVIKALTGAFQKGNIISTNEAAIANLSQICAKAAQQMGIAIQFEATDQSIGNYGYTGSATKQVDNIMEIGGIDAYQDDEVFIVKDKNQPLKGLSRLVSAENGMIGMPEFTDFGIKVKFLFDIQTKVGSEIKIDSKIYPAANGSYVIFKLDFDIANRETNFYYTAEARRLGGVL